MYERILAPVDLAHPDRSEKALKSAADLASHYDADLVLVGVTGNEPSSVAHTPEEYGEKLAAFAEAAADTSRPPDARRDDPRPRPDRRSRRRDHPQGGRDRAPISW